MCVCDCVGGYGCHCVGEEGSVWVVVFIAAVKYACVGGGGGGGVCVYVTVWVWV